ncbi:MULTISPECIES: hypothetical protein [unclassified Okeania]|uniref:hypothetical protein n=1 Tax=unclassified Okeania TaxID=2634635 RepID=UPI0013BD7FD0|nr:MULTISPECIES: hypothetical protein [unclassified Okeania]NES79755.1 hypothetical protein [Okeania sp. SIO1H4]NET12234.1 hypothetical protein [Okeania sp. SIO1H6]NET22601.1 hypothetical protein [Okeania sp. SIO1H5]NET95751.1 hypothetical protein [Okeania sp. SIO1H2]
MIITSGFNRYGIEYKEILFLLLVDGRTARIPRHPTQRVRYANDRCLGRLDMARGPRHPTQRVRYANDRFFPLKRGGFKARII